jgi:predicted HTH transcriptional regulator
MEAVHTQIHDDFLRIINPGGFVEGIRLYFLLVSGPQEIYYLPIYLRKLV